jgi:hypothetical protein
MVRYVQVNPKADLFSPVSRAFGNLAIVGDASSGSTNTPILCTSATDAKTNFTSGNLVDSITLAFAQTPGPNVVYGVRTTGTPVDWAGALTSLETQDVQLVALANTILDQTSATPSTGAIALLASHINSVSNSGDDGKERMGVAMLKSSSTDTSVTIKSDRMVYIAHKSTQDAAAAVAGTIAGYPPSISLLLKPVNIVSAPFTPGEIATINGVESFGSPPGGQTPHGVNWLVSPSLLPGGGIYLGEGYTGDAGGKKFIDITRTIDDISFSLKASLIRAIGILRISRPGLNALVAQMEAILDPLVRDGVITDYGLQLPILDLLNKDPASLTASELNQISTIRSSRVIKVFMSVTYAGAIHRLALTLNLVS